MLACAPLRADAYCLLLMCAYMCLLLLCTVRPASGSPLTVASAPTSPLTISSAHTTPSSSSPTQLGNDESDPHKLYTLPADYVPTPQHLPGFCPKLGPTFLAYLERHQAAVRWLREHASVNSTDAHLLELSDLPFRVLFGRPMNAGFGNRLACVATAYAVALLTDRVLLLDWSPPELNQYLVPRALDWHIDYLHHSILKKMRAVKALTIYYPWWHGRSVSQRVLGARQEVSRDTAAPLRSIKTIYLWGVQMLFDKSIQRASDSLQLLPSSEAEWLDRTNTTPVGCLLGHLFAPVAGTLHSLGTLLHTTVGQPTNSIIGVHIRNGDNPKKPRFTEAVRLFTNCAHRLENAHVAYGVGVDAGAGDGLRTTTTTGNATDPEHVVWVIVSDDERVAHEIQKLDNGRLPVHHSVRRRVMVPGHKGLSIRSGLHFAIQASALTYKIALRDFWLLTVSDMLIISPQSTFSRLAMLLALNHKPHLRVYDGSTCEPYNQTPPLI
jgi:hypothetical protein